MSIECGAEGNKFSHVLIDLGYSKNIENAIILEAELGKIERFYGTAEITLITEPDGSYPDLITEDVPFFYHCEDSDGSEDDLKKGHRAFANGEKVIILHIPSSDGFDAITYIVGHSVDPFSHGNKTWTFQYPQKCAPEYVVIRMGIQQRDNSSSSSFEDGWGHCFSDAFIYIRSIAWVIDLDTMTVVDKYENYSDVFDTTKYRATSGDGSYYNHNLSDYYPFKAYDIYRGGYLNDSSGSVTLISTKTLDSSEECADPENHTSPAKLSTYTGEWIDGMTTPANGSNSEHYYSDKEYGVIGDIVSTFNVSGDKKLYRVILPWNNSWNDSLDMATSMTELRVYTTGFGQVDYGFDGEFIVNSSYFLLTGDIDTWEHNIAYEAKVQKYIFNSMAYVNKQTSAIEGIFSVSLIQDPMQYGLNYSSRTTTFPDWDDPSDESYGVTRYIVKMYNGTVDNDLCDRPSSYFHDNLDHYFAFKDERTYKVTSPFFGVINSGFSLKYEWEEITVEREGSFYRPVSRDSATYFKDWIVVNSETSRNVTHTLVDDFGGRPIIANEVCSMGVDGFYVMAGIVTLKNTLVATSSFDAIGTMKGSYSLNTYINNGKVTIDLSDKTLEGFAFGYASIEDINKPISDITLSDIKNKLDRSKETQLRTIVEQMVSDWNILDSGSVAFDDYDGYRTLVHADDWNHNADWCGGLKTSERYPNLDVGFTIIPVRKISNIPWDDR